MSVFLATHSIGSFEVNDATAVTLSAIGAAVCFYITASSGGTYRKKQQLALLAASFLVFSMVVLRGCHLVERGALELSLIWNNIRLEVRHENWRPVYFLIRNFFSLESPSYRDILRSVQPVAEVSLSNGELIVGVDADDTIISANYKDGTSMIRNTDTRGGQIVLVASPDGSFWYMNAPDCWLRLA